MHPTSATRRSFLKQSAVTATAAAGSLSIARGAHAAGDDTIKVGVVGCGGRGGGAAVNAMDADPGVRLVAMGDLFADRVQGRRAVLKRHRPDQVLVDDDHCFVGLDGYKKVIDSVDVVLIACAAKFHPMYLKAGIEAGKHVFVEKPHGIDPAGIKVVAEATALAKQKNLGILSGLQSRFDPRIRATIERVRDGQIGEIISIEENFIRGPYGRTTHPGEGMRELEVQYGNQYRFSWLCGDDVPQSLVHNMDRATWALGEMPPVDAHGLGGRSGPQKILGDVFDHNSVVYRYANGVRVYAFCRTTMGCYNESSSIILGSKGIAYPIHGRISGENEWRAPRGGNPYLIEHQEFFKSIRAGEPRNCGDYMGRSTLVTVMGQLSCYSGKLVTWDQVTKSDYVIEPKPESCTWDMDPPTAPDENGIYPVCAIPGITRNI